MLGGRAAPGMRSAETQACVYLVAARGSGLIRIGVASDPGQRLRELQVGSPLKLELAHVHPCPDRPAAEAIVAELERRFAGRHEHGHWYRLEVGTVRSALANPATLAAPEAAAAARALAAAESARREAAFKRRRGRGSRARTEKELAYQRRRQRERVATQKRAARLLARGLTQAEAAAALAVTPRTLRNWRQAPAFERALARERERLAARTASAAPARPRPRHRSEPKPERPAEQPEPQPEAAAEAPASPSSLNPRLPRWRGSRRAGSTPKRAGSTQTTPDAGGSRPLRSAPGNATENSNKATHQSAAGSDRSSAGNHHHHHLVAAQAKGDDAAALWRRSALGASSAIVVALPTEGDTRRQRPCALSPMD
jgi:hypothetical protein